MANVKFKKEWLPSDLLEFLEAEGVTDKFINAIHNVPFGKDGGQDYFEGGEESDYIAYAFIWVLSEEGQGFWGNIDEKWKEYLNGK